VVISYVKTVVNSGWIYDASRCLNRSRIF